MKRAKGQKAKLLSPLDVELLASQLEKLAQKYRTDFKTLQTKVKGQDKIQEPIITLFSKVGAALENYTERTRADRGELLNLFYYSPVGQGLRRAKFNSAKIQKVFLDLVARGEISVSSTDPENIFSLKTASEEQVKIAAIACASKIAESKTFFKEQTSTSRVRFAMCLAYLVGLDKNALDKVSGVKCQASMSQRWYETSLKNRSLIREQSDKWRRLWCKGIISRKYPIMQVFVDAESRVEFGPVSWEWIA